MSNCPKHGSRRCALRIFGVIEQHSRCCYCGHRVATPNGIAPAQTRSRPPWWWFLEPALRWRARHWL